MGQNLPRRVRFPRAEARILRWRAGLGPGVLPAAR
jgi:hypothetical protein